MTKYVTEPSKKLPISDECEVLVCGGGIAGIAAALAAARNGAKVTLIERQFMLGGLATLGLVTIYLPLCDGNGTQVSFGIADELLRLSISRGVIEAKAPTPWLENGSPEERKKVRFEVQYNPQLFAADAEKLLIDSGVKILYGTLAAETIVDNSRITAVIIENKSGRSAISVGSVVDCTGDADICKLSGAQTAQHKKGNVLAAWYYRYSNASGIALKMLGFADIVGDDTRSSAQQLVPTRFTGLDGEEISKMTILAHQKAVEDVMKLRETDPTAVPTTFPTIPQLRMTRRLVGISTPTDQPTHKFEKTSVGLYSDWRKRGPVYELPFEALYGSTIKNLITAGRNISVTDELWDITRVIPVCAVSGEAAGTAAAISNDFASLDINILQKKLIDAGVKLHCSDVGLKNS